MHVLAPAVKQAAKAQPRSAMMVRPTVPATIGTLPRNRALVFLSLFFVPAVAQAILLTVVPLEALKLLGSARAVTLVYVAAGTRRSDRTF